MTTTTPSTAAGMETAADYLARYLSLEGGDFYQILTVTKPDVFVKHYAAHRKAAADWCRKTATEWESRAAGTKDDELARTAREKAAEWARAADLLHGEETVHVERGERS